MMRNHTYHECSNCFSLYPDVEVAKMATVPHDENDKDAEPYWTCPYCFTESDVGPSKVTVQYTRPKK